MIVRTAAGLNALPGNSVVLDADGDAWQKDELVGRWWEAKGWRGSSSAAEIEHHGPFRTMRVATESTLDEFMRLHEQMGARPLPGTDEGGA